MPVEQWSESIVVCHLGNNPQFTDDLEALDRKLTQRKVDAVLDFAAVAHINSSDIARLLRIRKQMVTTESRLVLCGLNTHIWSTFLVTGLDKIFQFSDNVALALASLQLNARLS
jgi:anti-anti-sigma factor